MSGSPCTINTLARFGNLDDRTRSVMSMLSITIPGTYVAQHGPVPLDLAGMARPVRWGYFEADTSARTPRLAYLGQDTSAASL